MFAVIKTGGKQYRVEENNIIKIEKLDSVEGDAITFDHVLMIGDAKKSTIGSPLIAGAKVEALILSQMRDRKVIIFKKKRRQNYRRKKGHRQHLTVVKITKIIAS
jgi:large subunit ribosomal protein L21